MHISSKSTMELLASSRNAVVDSLFLAHRRVPLVVRPPQSMFLIPAIEPLTQEPRSVSAKVPSEKSSNHLTSWHTVWNIAWVGWSAFHKQQLGRVCVQFVHKACLNVGHALGRHELRVQVPPRAIRGAQVQS